MGFCFAVSFYFSCNNKVSICNSVNYRYRVVVATAKVQIFKQITTPNIDVDSYTCCCCYRKGTNFQANHNRQATRCHALSVVVATAKVQIFKQITTKKACPNSRPVLLLLPQRYKFSSKSQREAALGLQEACCCCYRKGTNFQANHNRLLKIYARQWVVVATAKVQIFKQITTAVVFLGLFVLLLLLPQRYKFSSKSQPSTLPSSCEVCCCCYRKGTNFQANHNGEQRTPHSY